LEAIVPRKTDRPAGLEMAVVLLALVTGLVELIRAVLA